MLVAARGDDLQHFAGASWIRDNDAEFVCSETTPRSGRLANRVAFKRSVLNDLDICAVWVFPDGDVINQGFAGIEEAEEEFMPGARVV